MASFWTRIREMMNSPAEEEQQAADAAREDRLERRAPGRLRQDEEIGAVADEFVAAKRANSEGTPEDGVLAERRGTKVTVRYSGRLARQGRPVYLHYGFGAEWSGTAEMPMEQVDAGVCEAAVSVRGRRGTLEFCFRNDAGEWDNHDGKNWSCPL